jgi:predicted Zn-dependent peptidase
MMICQKTLLSNGVRVVSETLPQAQSFALGVWIDAGSRDEEPQQHGMVHFIEHLVFRGTQKRTSRKIANELESVGGYLNAFTTKDHTCFYTRALTQHFDLSLDMLADICLHPLFREQDIRKERSIIIEEIKSLQDEAEELITDHVDELLFAQHPYAHPISGTAESLAQISKADIHAFHQTHFTTDRIIIAAAGNIRHETLCRQVEQLFADAPKKNHPQSHRPQSSKKRVSQSKSAVQELSAPRAFTLPLRHKASVREVEIPTQQMHLCMGTLLPKPSDAEYYTLSALNIVLGDGMSSRLNQVIREKHGLCYNIYSGTSEIGQSLIMSIYAGFEPSQRKKVETLIAKEVQQLLDKPISKQELRRAKEQLKSSLIIGLESLSGRMNLLAKSELYVGMFEEIDEKLTKIEAITTDNILEIAHQYLSPDAWHTALIIPKE